MPPSPIDLTTVQAVKTWLSSAGKPPTNVQDDPAMQACITSFSWSFLLWTGMAQDDGSNTDQSPFVQVVTYDEFYDGNGSFRMFLRRRPIRTVITLTINGTIQVPVSQTPVQRGYVIDSGKSSVSLRGYLFCKGVQNVEFVHTAGYDTTPPDIELAARKTAALNYKRKDWIGRKSSAMAQGAGTTTYEEWEMEPDVVRVIHAYTRWAIV